MKLKATTILTTEKQRIILEKLSKGTSISLNYKTRSKIILLASEGLSHGKIAKECNVDITTVRKWRKRWLKKYPELLKVEEEHPRRLKSAIESALEDEYRSGSPGKFTDEQQAHIINISLQSPKFYGLEISEWTYPAIVKEAIRQKIVENISASQVSRFLKRYRY